MPELPRRFALIADSVLAVTNAFVDGFVDTLQGLLTDLPDVADQPLAIPMLSWLYQRDGDRLRVNIQP
ncbi:MAG: hypothetical protein JO023_15915 [Chloroflexi bacterium]|nr:hypothetical protein [Chloroflexota bacterium]